MAPQSRDALATLALFCLTAGRRVLIVEPLAKLHQAPVPTDGLPRCQKADSLPTKIITEGRHTRAPVAGIDGGPWLWLDCLQFVAREHRADQVEQRYQVVRCPTVEGYDQRAGEASDRPSSGGPGDDPHHNSTGVQMDLQDGAEAGWECRVWHATRVARRHLRGKARRVSASRQRGRPSGVSARHDGRPLVLAVLDQLHSERHRLCQLELDEPS